ncbi:hypothetical protein IFM47457_11381 [Aspergillus lentulus]|nr:hypothetical protein IFM47457_11381 [Aspergillus lentulus]
MVEKDSRALLPAELQVWGGSRKRDATEMESSTNSERKENEWRAPKQRLIEHQSDSYGDSRASLYTSFDNQDNGGK